MVGQRLEKAAPAIAVWIECVRGIAEIALEHDGSAVIERMCEGRSWMNPFDSILLQGKLRKEWRPGGDGVDSRSEIMMKAGKRERQRARASADDGLRLVYIDSVAGFCQHNRSGEAVRA